MRFALFYALLATVLATIFNFSQAAADCVYDIKNGKCQCAEMRSGGAACLHLESGSGKSAECTATKCEDGMKCDCAGFEVCTIEACPAYVARARAGAAIVIGKNVDCAISGPDPTAAGASGLRDVKEPTCVKAIPSSWTATVKTIDAAKAASDTAKTYVSETAEIVAYLIETVSILASQSQEAESIVSSIPASANQFAHCTDLAVAIESDVVAAAEDRKKVESDLKVITGQAGASLKGYENALATDDGLLSMEKKLESLQKELDAIDRNEDSYGAWIMGDRIYFLKDKYQYDKYMTIEYKHHAGTEAREARANIIACRKMFSASIERRNSCEAKLKELKEANRS